MDFMDEVKNMLDNEKNISLTENGAVGYRTSTNALVDMNFMVSSLRRENPLKIINMFHKCYHEDPVLAMKWLFMVRDVREGMGERRLFRIVMASLAQSYPEMVRALIPMIPEMGRWDDLLSLFDTAVEDSVLSFIKKSLEKDLALMKENKPCSLLAKWLPSQNTSNRDTINYGIKIAKYLGMTPRQYRKTLSSLRGYTKVLEHVITTDGWGSINYEAVPSKANIKYKSSFLRHDSTRRREYLSRLATGDAKINSAVLYPHDIVQSYIDESLSDTAIKPYDEALESMWKALFKDKSNISNTLVVRDGSYSMTTKVNGIQVLSVASALAIYFASLTEGEFHDKFITFSSRPELVTFKANDSLHQKLEFLKSFNDCSTTDLEKVFELILDVAVKNNLRQEELPERLLIVSDMEFNRATRDPSANLMESIANRYAEQGYRLPKLIFWNLCSRSSVVPLKENELGVALVSGFSPNIMNMLTSDNLDPYDIIKDALNVPRYEFVEEVVKKYGIK